MKNVEMVNELRSKQNDIVGDDSASTQFSL